MPEECHPVRRTPTTEDELRAVTIGDLKPQVGPIELVAPDPSWPGIFERESNRIRGALGDRALLLEHVGSTSVPGLAAKPIVDILLVVADSADEPSYLGPLGSAGYILRIREPDWHEHRMFKGPDTDINLHVFSECCSEIERMQLFRDRLRADTDERQAYERTKRELAQRPWQYTQQYADAKGQIVEAIIQRARADRSA